MSEDAANPTPARKRAAPRVPGDTSADAANPTPADDGVEDAAPPTRHALPDFRHKSAEYARQWFEKNPTAIKRAVLTHEGWYVHPETFKEARRAEV